MRFCTNCNNMYYLRIAEDNPNKIVYYCRNCGTEDQTMGPDNVVVASTYFNKSSSKKDFSTIINKYTKLDPTLPRVSNIPCPNSECPTNHEKANEREIIYLRYDDAAMKYAYLCSTCDTTWAAGDV